MQLKNSSMNCQSIKDELMTELQKPSVMKTSMKSFHEKLLLFVDNYCASLDKINVTELHVIFHKWYISIMDLYRTTSYFSSIKVLIDEILQATGLQSEETKEITEMLKEIVAATIHVGTTDAAYLLKNNLP